MNLVTQVLWNFEVRFILVVMALDTRRIVHVAVTGSPSLDWVKLQLTEATPWGVVPRFLLHDNDACSDEPLYTGYEDNIVQVAPAPAVGNLLGDDRPEIVVPSYDGYLRCYGPDGVLAWDYVFDSPAATSSAPPAWRSWT